METLLIWLEDAVSFPAPEWLLTTIGNSSSNTFFQLLWPIPAYSTQTTYKEKSTCIK